MARKPLSESKENEEPKKKSGKEKPEQSIAQRWMSKTKIDGLELAATLDQSKMSNISEWISTGSFALNRVISGSYYKGLPRGRIVGLAGASGVGKSFVCGNCIREAQKQGYTCIVFDSENAIDMTFLERIGVNTADVIHVPVNTIHEVKMRAVKMMREFRAEYPDGKLFIVIDSIGGLLTENEFNAQIENNSTAMDMGLRAKQLRVLSKILTAEVAISQAIMVVTNHTYEQAAANPQAAPTVKMVGGEGFIYATSAIVFLKKSLEKEEGENLVTGKTEKQVKGAILKAHSEKNRFIPQGAKGEIYISFEKGVNRWYGMLEDAMEFGMITNESVGWYTLPGGVKVRKKELYKAEVWKPLLEELNAKVEAKFAFKKFNDADDISNELDNTSDEDVAESDPNS